MKKHINILFLILAADFSAQTYTGNVGINTAAPEKTLDINGELRSLKTDVATNTQYLLETNNISNPGKNINAVISPDFTDGSSYISSKDFNFLTTTKPNGLSSNIYTGASLASSYSAMRASYNEAYASFNTHAQPTFAYASMEASQNGFYSTISSHGNITLDARSDASTFLEGINVIRLEPGLVGGVSFTFINGPSTTFGEYTFPRNYGKRGQVLVTHGNPLDPGNGNSSNVLVWRNVADLIILKSPGGNCYKITVSDAGVLGTTADPDCMVDAYNTDDYASRTVGSSSNTSLQRNVQPINIEQQLLESKKRTKLIQENIKMLKKNAFKKN